MILSCIMLTAVAAEQHHGAAYDASLVAAKTSAACGGTTGLFALQDIAPGARLVTVPVAKCVTAAAALRHSFLGPRLRARFGARAGADGDETRTRTQCPRRASRAGRTLDARRRRASRRASGKRVPLRLC